MEENVLTQQEPETEQLVPMPQAQEEVQQEQKVVEVIQHEPSLPPLDVTQHQANAQPQPAPVVAEPEMPAEPAKKQKKEKKIRNKEKVNTGVPKRLSPAKIGSFILYLLQVAIVALCGIQLVMWGISIAAHGNEYVNAIMGMDYVNIVMIAMMLIFISVMVGNLICSILAILKKNTQFVVLVTTYLAFYLFWRFIPTVFDGRVLLVSHLNFYLINFVAVLVAAYAAVRLIDSDIGSRIVPFIFSCIMIVLVVAMFVLRVGNFATIHIDGYGSFEINQLNPERYFMMADTYFNNPDAMQWNQESVFFTTFVAGDFFDLNGDQPPVVIALQFIMVLVAKMLPYMALSLLGYLIHGLLGKNYEQYYNLLSCKKMMRMTFTTALLAMFGTVFMYFCTETSRISGFHLEFNVFNCGMTAGLCIVGLILTSTPWRVYNRTYKRKYKKYKNNEGRKQYGNSAM